MAVDGRAGLHLPGPNPLQHFARRNVFALVVPTGLVEMIMGL
jgi:hypothetical protein